MAWQDAIAALNERFPELKLEPRPLMIYLNGKDSGQFYVRVEPRDLNNVMQFLRDDPRCKFEQMSDVTCVDYLNYPDPPSDERFGVTYSLLSLTHNHRLWVKVFVSDPEPTVPTMSRIWKGASWTEREVFDMFGIRFAGHPDLRRILCPDWFQDYALRKDYPLSGRGEREQFEIVRRDSA